MSQPMNGNSITQRVMIQTSIREQNLEQVRAEVRKQEQQRVAAQGERDKGRGQVHQ